MDARPLPVALSKPAIPTLPFLTCAPSLLATAVKHFMVCFMQPNGRYLLLFSWVPSFPAMEAVSFLTLPGITCFSVVAEPKQLFPRTPPPEGLAHSKPVSEPGPKHRTRALGELGELCTPGLSTHMAEENEKHSALGFMAMLSVIPGSPSWPCSMLSVKYRVNPQVAMD